MPSREIQVTREQVITPTGVTYNDFNDMFVAITDGDSIKVTKKHMDIQETILHALDEKRAVKLSYSEYMNKEYVAKAEYFNGKPTEPVQNAKYDTNGNYNAPQSTGKPSNTQSSTKTQPTNNQPRSFALSYAKDIGVAMITSGKEVSVKTVLDIADQFLAWLNK